MPQGPEFSVFSDAACPQGDCGSWRGCDHQPSLGRADEPGACGLGGREAGVLGLESGQADAGVMSLCPKVLWCHPGFWQPLPETSPHKVSLR